MARSIFAAMHRDGPQILPAGDIGTDASSSSSRARPGFFAFFSLSFNPSSGDKMATSPRFFSPEATVWGGDTAGWGKDGAFADPEKAAAIPASNPSPLVKE